MTLTVPSDVHVIELRKDTDYVLVFDPAQVDFDKLASGTSGQISDRVGEVTFIPALNVSEQDFRVIEKARIVENATKAFFYAELAKSDIEAIAKSSHTPESLRMVVADALKNVNRALEIIPHIQASNAGDSGSSIV